MSKLDMERIVYLDTKEIDYSRDKITARFETELPESEELESLYNSIRKDGIIEPIIVRPKGTERYEVIAGNRRLRTAKRAKLETIPSIITDFNDVQALRIGYIENIHRRDLKPIQKAKGIAAIYANVGIPKEIAIMKVKHLHNSKSRTPAKSQSIKATVAEPTPEFLEAFESIALSANTQYELLQLVTQLPTTVQDTIEETNLSEAKARLLTHSGLKKDPGLQRILAHEIKNKNVTFPQARSKVRQAVSDLETGTLYKDKDIGYGVDYSNRIKITEKPELEQPSFNSTILEHMDAMDKLIGKLIERPLARGEVFYTKEIVEPKLRELEKKIATAKKEYRDRLAISASMMLAICGGIISASH